MLKEVELSEGLEWDYKFPCCRIIVGPVQTWVHALSFSDVNTCKMWAINYTMEKEKRKDFHNIKPDPGIMKACAVIRACRQGEYSEEMSFKMPMGRETKAIDQLMNLLPEELIDRIFMISKELSIKSLVPIKDEEQIEKEETAKDFFTESLTDEKTWEHLNYFSYVMFEKPLHKLDNMTIGDALNVISRDENAKQMIVETIGYMVELLAKVG